MSQRIPVIVIDDTPIKRRGVCEFVEETPQLLLRGQAGDSASATALIEKLVQEQATKKYLSPAGWCCPTCVWGAIMV